MENEFYEKSQAVLELPRVLALLAEQAVSDPAKELCLALRPSAERAEVISLQKETSAAKMMMVVRSSPAFGGVKDVRGSLARADMGGMLNTRELLDIAAVLTSARLVSGYVDSRGEKTELDWLFRSLVSNRFLEDRIITSIPAENEIADAASPELADIRRKMRAASARVRDALQKIISSPAYSKALQDSIITQRSDRYVVPVKAEYKSSVPGLVHDVSSSGATLFIEPMAVVKANNELRELRARENQEIDRILMELSADCAGARDNITLDFSVLVKLDCIFARAKLSYAMDCCEPVISDGFVDLRRARHPLLNKDSAVPISLDLGRGFDTLVITGPNTGGKTVSLKTLGLLCLMSQCGLHIPAGDGSAVPILKRVLADIGDEQSIEQSLSTFSSHMTNIVKILGECGPDTLLLFDELGAGTDPTEGAALAMAIIESARQLGALVAATTHYAELKVYATNTPGVQNACCEFDVETLRPTYRLLIGIPGKSNAFAVSRRLGLPENIIEDAKSRMSTESASFEETIAKLEEQRRLLENDRLESSKALRAAEENAKKSERLKRELEVRLEKADLKARREAEQIIADARAAADEALREIDDMRRAQNEEDSHQRINEARTEMRRRLNEAASRVSRPEPEPEARQESARPVEPGDTVEMRALGVKASVISVSPERVLTLQAGIMRVTAREDEVLLVESAKKEARTLAQKSAAALRTLSVAPELDIRGMMTDEAELMVERYLDSAAMAGLKTVTIIHGKGTGALRQGVQTYLKRAPHVKSFRFGRYGEGETGVTVVELR